MNNAIEVQGVHKFYGSFKAVSDISFQVAKGELFAFLGENGAGKSTTIDMLCTLANPSKGTAFVNGFRCGLEDQKIRSTIGVVFQYSMLDDLLTVRENLITRCGFYKLYGADAKKRIAFLSDCCELKDILNQKVCTLSGGQRRRADIARALIPSLELLILDEPTTGLDPAGRERIWQTINALRESFGITVFLTTHYMEEAKNADHVCVIKKGKIIADGTPQEIKEKYACDTLYVSSEYPQSLYKELQHQRIPFTKEHDRCVIVLKRSMEALAILRRIENYISGFEVVSGTLDDAFIQLMKGEG